MCPSSDHDFREDAHAVVIGVNCYKDPGIPDLSFARADAEAIYKTLTDPDLGRFDPANVELLVDADATERNIRSALATRLPKRAGPDDIVVVYFAGHGAPAIDPLGLTADGFEKYLVPQDGLADDLRSSGIRMDDIDRFFGYLESSQVIFFIDACYAGTAGGRSFQHPRLGSRAILTDEFLEKLGSTGRVVMAACGAREVSLEAAELGHGVFTYYLLEGLRSAAASSGDRPVSVDDLYNFVYDRVERQARAMGGRMNPLRSGMVQGTVYLIGGPSGEKEPRRARARLPTGLALGENAADRETLGVEADDRVPIQGFKRALLSGLTKIEDATLWRELASATDASSAKARSITARKLRRAMSASHLALAADGHGLLGPAYTAWSIGRVGFLSVLPGVGGDPKAQAQKTLEFELLTDEKRLALRALWYSDHAAWLGISFDEYHSTVGGLASDRTGVALAREATLLVLEKRGASFGFPVAPSPGPAEKFCGWVPLPTDEAHWDWERDPRLSDPHLHWTVVEHQHGAGIFAFEAQGAWPNRAIYAVDDALESLLPGRYDLDTRKHGRLAGAVLVSQCEESQDRRASRRTDSPEPAELEHTMVCIERSKAALGRMVAAMYNYQVPAIEVDPVPPPRRELLAPFRKALIDFSELKGLPRVSIVGGFRHSVYEWIELADSQCSARMGLDSELLAEYDLPFDQDRLLGFIKAKENRPQIDHDARMDREHALAELRAELNRLTGMADGD